MNRSLAAGVTLLVGLITLAEPTHAQRRTSIGLAAGASVPIGDLGDATSTGFHALGTLSVSGTATMPLGLRIDGMYNSLSGKREGPDVNVWTVNGNLVYAFPGGLTATPYLIGGAGWYNLKADGADEGTNELGINAGIGARFALSGFSTFAEVRFHNVFTDDNSAQLIPITFGILF